MVEVTQEDMCDICCRPRSRHISRDLQCPETTYFRAMPPTALAAKEAENAELRAKVEKLREAAHNLRASVNSPEGFSLSAVKSASEAVEAALTETQP